jgi:thiamine biosynthesis lipoprotein ApbE
VCFVYGEKMYDSQRRLAGFIIVVLAFGVVLIFLARGLAAHNAGSRLLVERRPAETIGTATVQVTAVGADSNVTSAAIYSALAAARTALNEVAESDANSELARVNRNAYAGPVTVSDGFFELLCRCRRCSIRTDFAFDITAQPLLKLCMAEKIADDNELAAARARVGIDKLVLDSNSRSVRFGAEGVQLTLSTVAAGYAADCAVAAMKRASACGGMVQVDADIACFGTPAPPRRSWRVVLSEPNIGDANVGLKQPLMLVLNDRCAAVKPGCDDIAETAVIAESAVEADALCSAINVAGQQKGFDFINEEHEAVLVISNSPEHKMYGKNEKQFFAAVWPFEHVKKGNL